MINRLRAAISEAKNPTIHVSAPARAPASPSLATELAGLADLHARRVLSDEEFSTAKAAVLARLS